MANPPIFVIQKHDARRLHYDVRLEVGGVLVSWAVPRGPSTDPAVKRLAVPTSDHEISYASFEGTTSPATYGTGAVIVWDAGVYDVLPSSDGTTRTMPEGLARGHFKVWLHGVKLSGGWAFTRTGDGPKAQWLMVKVKDEEADPTREIVEAEPRSILTNRTIEDIVAGR